MVALIYRFFKDKIPCKQKFFIKGCYRDLFGKLIDVIKLSKFYIYLSHTFLIIVITCISKPNFNRLSFKFTTQVSLFTTGQMDY